MNKSEATLLGKALLNRMPKGWKLDIWDNMGWCYRVYLGKHVSVYPCWDEDKFFCLMGDMPNAGKPEWTDNFTSKDPMEVVKHTLNIAKKDVEKLQKVVEIVEKGLTV